MAAALIARRRHPRSRVAPRGAARDFRATCRGGRILRAFSAMPRHPGARPRAPLSRAPQARLAIRRRARPRRVCREARTTHGASRPRAATCRTHDRRRRESGLRLADGPVVATGDPGEDFRVVRRTRRSESDAGVKAITTVSAGSLANPMVEQLLVEFEPRAEGSRRIWSRTEAGVPPPAFFAGEFAVQEHLPTYDRADPRSRALTVEICDTVARLGVVGELEALTRRSCVCM